MYVLSGARKSGRKYMVTTVLQSFTRISNSPEYHTGATLSCVSVD